MRLLPFQRRFILEIYDNPAGTRRAYLSVARKAGKTALIAAILLAHLVGPEARENAQLVSGARSRDQASIVFRYASDMLRMSPALTGRARVVPSGKRIIGIGKNTEYRALSAEAGTAHGLSPVLAILDEVGQIKGEQDDFIDAIVTAQGAHEAPLLLAISTQAPNDAALFSRWLDDAQQSGDQRIVCHLYAAPEDAELDDPAAWAAANPGLGATCTAEDMAEAAARAIRMASEENSFRNLRLNQRVSLFDPFVSRAVWTAGGGEVLPFAGPVWGGLDLSQTTDLTAFVLVGKDAAGNWAVRPRFWMASELIEERARKDREPYDRWAREGFLTPTPGKSVDYGWVARDLADTVAGLDLRGVAFDRWGISALQRHLELEGLALPLEPWGQGFASMSPAVTALEIELLHERLRHGMHPVLTMCARNAVVQRDPSGNRKLDKAKSTGRIDGMVALAMAMGLAMTQAQEALPEPGIVLL